MFHAKPVYNPVKEKDETFNLPYRTDVVRPTTDFDDLAREVVTTFNTYCRIESNVSPLVARNVDNNIFILSKDWIHEKVKNSFKMESIMYGKMLDSVVAFYAKNKISKRLPSPHIISHRSVHYTDQLFDIFEIDKNEYLKLSPNKVRNFRVDTVHQLNIFQIGTLYIENMRKGTYKYLVLRPKLGKSGAPTIDRWEVLLFKSHQGYMIEHIDTDKNPRYNGNI
jgi:hypothetical protein